MSQSPQVDCAAFVNDQRRRVQAAAGLPRVVHLTPPASPHFPPGLLVRAGSGLPDGVVAGRAQRGAPRRTHPQLFVSGRRGNGTGHRGARNRHPVRPRSSSNPFCIELLTSPVWFDESGESWGLLLGGDM